MKHIIRTVSATLTALLIFFSHAINAADPNPIVAVVNGHEISRGYVYKQLEALPLGDQIAVRAQLNRFVDSLVREEVLFQFMLASDFADEPQLRETIKTAVVNQLIENHVSKRINVTNADVLKYYKDNASAIRDENVRASQILLRTLDECASLIATIDSDTSFAAAARAHSLHRDSAQKDGDIGLFMNHNGPLGFEAKFFDLQPGDMRLFESEDGCHLVRIMARETPPMPPLEQVEAQIRTLIERQQQIDLLRALIEKASTSIPVERQK
ncbi:MAG: foldase protein PrsA [Gammaproteobacteria bacterium]|jgi:foldase protein PrsA